MGAFVLRREQDDAPNVVDEFLRDRFGLDKLSAVNDPVTDRFDRVDELLCSEEFLDFDDRFLVGRAVEMKFRLAFRTFGLEVTVHADVFDETV